MSLVVFLWKFLVAYYRKMVEKRARGGATPVLVEVCACFRAALASS